MSNSFIDIKNLTVFYRSKKVVDNVSITIKEGDFVALLGPNGAGKSTLIKTILRVVSNFSGSIKLFGSPLSSYSQKDIAKIFGYVPQNPPQVLDMSVEDFVLLSRYPFLKPLAPLQLEDRNIIDRAISECGLEEFRERLLSTLSGGELQIALLAGALASLPKVLLLDEPTSSLDPSHVDKFHKIVADVRSKRNVTVILVTHDINVAVFYGQRIIGLKEGSVHYDGSALGFMKQDVLRSMYGKSFVTTPHPNSQIPMVLPDYGTL